MRFLLKITILIVSFSISFCYSGLSQDTLRCQIKWLPSVPSWFKSDSAQNKVLLYFENARYNETGIPVFNKSIPVEDQCSDLSLQILSLSFDTVPVTNSYSRLNDIPENISFSADILRTEKKNFGQISVIPVIRKNEKLLLLKSFTVVLEKSYQRTTKKRATSIWKTASVLSSGTWRKIAVSKTGVYKISFGELKNMGFTEPANIKIFGNGGSMLPERFTGSKTDDLNEIPVFIAVGSDEKFNEGDYLYFYATGPLTWSYDAVSKKFIHSKHNFTNKTYYFLTTGENGARITDADPVNTAEEVIINSFSDYVVHEENLYNLIKSGRNWVGEHFGQTVSRNFNFSFPDPVENSQFTIEGEVLARSQVNTGFTLRYNNQALVNQTMSRVYTNDETSNHADSRAFLAKSTIAGKDMVVNLNFDNRGDNSAEGWLNYLRINARRKLRFNTDQLLFRDTTALFQSKTALFTIDNASASQLLWDVTNIHKVKSIKYTITGQQITYKALTDTLRNYVLFDPAKAFTPDFLKDEGNAVENQNLHALYDIKMVIISHKTLLAEADEIAEIHRNTDNFSVVTVTPEQIYNEFSSGNPDPAAYRNFMKMLYDKAQTQEQLPRYLLLMGDGSYKNLSDKPASQENNSNLILTYQSANSLRPVSSYVSDDYFGLLDDNESIEMGLLDIGIGRIPVSTPKQAKAIVNKIKRYISASSYGSWRNNLCFLADDEDGNIHMAQADQLSAFAGVNHPSYNLLKVYIDAFPQVTTSTGPRYPEVNKAIEDNLNRGVLILNYTGHGGIAGLAHEQILLKEEIKRWNNSVYPLFVTATCEFSRFDEYEITTAGEEVLLNENGGGIALLSTTRLVYSGPNFVLNQEFFRNFAGRENNGDYYRLGDLMKRTKNSSGTDINKLSFTLLGDPALRLAYPQMNVKTTHINGNDISLATDTLKAYKEVTVKGIITDLNGNHAPGFNGLIYPTLYDKEQTVKTLNNDNTNPFSYRQQESILYKGKATVRNGEFEFMMVIPREIAYNYGKGKLSYYASGENTDAAGHFDQFIIGGISAGAIIDQEGPEIRLYMNNKDFVPGGITNQFPTLLATLSDENGINLSGTSIGHNIIGILDNNTANSFVLNNYFESETDNHRKGSIEYKLPQLAPGKHTISLKAWDIFNNSSIAEIAFEVADSSFLQVKNLYNYPNPFSEITTFSFEHNQPGKNLDAELQIFSVTGNLISSERFIITSEGFTSGPVIWDGTKNKSKKPERGIYIYRFIFRYNGTKIMSESKKMIVSE